MDPVGEGVADREGGILAETDTDPVLVGEIEGDAVLDDVVVAERELDLEGVKEGEILGVGEQM